MSGTRFTVPLLLLLAVAALGLAPPAASAALTILPGDTTIEVLDRTGQPEVRAGARPDRLLQSFKFTVTDDAPEDAKEVAIDLPAGLGGNPAAVPPCPRRLINTPIGSCPPESRIGTFLAGGESNPVYSVEPAPNQVAVFAAATFLSPISFVAALRPGDLGLSLGAGDFPQSSIFPVREGQIELWGIPADHQEGTAIARKPLLTLPTRCDGPPLAATVRMRTWQNPGRWVSGSGSTGGPLVGCGGLRFDPSLDFSLGAPSADTPSGMRIDTRIPQNEDPDGLATAQVKDVSVLMPAGMTISPGAAASLSLCSDAQFGLGSSSDPTCPPSSRVGSVELDSPALDKPMVGAIYLGAQAPGERFRLFVVAGARGAVVKLAGALRPDPESGRLTASLRDLPQAALERMSLTFDGGPDALLATPLSCGPVTTTATLTPSSASAPVSRAGTVVLVGPGGSACTPPAFAPTLVAGTTKTRPGRPTAFTATVRRQDGEQLPERLSLTLPPGISAALGSVAPCPGPAAAAGTCPPSSRVGKTLAELGPGPSPARVEGNLFLTGPYRRAPFGLALTFRAALGPFDLGTIVLRAALGVDPRSGQVTITTDRLPRVFEGIPIRFQTIGLDLDRPGFIRNPTSCGPARVSAELRSAEGAMARLSTPFALRNCIALPFRPALAMALRGRAGLRAGDKPGLGISARLRAGGANLRSLQLTLPRALGFDQGAPAQICARGEALQGDCPKGSEIGSASARTPLLDGAMKGSIYLAQPPANGLPDLWAKLEGQGIEVNLRGETALEEGRAVTRFGDVPDFPLSSLRLRFAGGERGLLELQASPCGGLVAPARIGGQNGAQVRTPVAVTVRGSCGPERQRGRAGQKTNRGRASK